MIEHYAVLEFGEDTMCGKVAPWVNVKYMFYTEIAANEYCAQKSDTTRRVVLCHLCADVPDEIVPRETKGE